MNAILPIGFGEKENPYKKASTKNKKSSSRSKRDNKYKVKKQLPKGAKNPAANTQKVPRRALSTGSSIMLT